MEDSCRPLKSRNVTDRMIESMIESVRHGKETGFRIFEDDNTKTLYSGRIISGTRSSVSQFHDTSIPPRKKEMEEATRRFLEDTSFGSFHMHIPYGKKLRAITDEHMLRPIPSGGDIYNLVKSKKRVTCVGIPTANFSMLDVGCMSKQSLNNLMNTTKENDPKLLSNILYDNAELRNRHICRTHIIIPQRVEKIHSMVKVASDTSRIFNPNQPIRQLTLAQKEKRLYKNRLALLRRQISREPEYSRKRELLEHELMKLLGYE